jgi:hypothetical protein
VFSFHLRWSAVLVTANHNKSIALEGHHCHPGARFSARSGYFQAKCS